MHFNDSIALAKCMVNAGAADELCWALIIAAFPPCNAHDIVADLQLLS